MQRASGAVLPAPDCVLADPLSAFILLRLKGAIIALKRKKRGLLMRGFEVLGRTLVDDDLVNEAFTASKQIDATKEGQQVASSAAGLRAHRARAVLQSPFGFELMRCTLVLAGRRRPGGPGRGAHA